MLKNNPNVISNNFLFEYNHLKRHEGLKYIPPYEKLEKVTELLS
jgi:hypothetical protein